jgi:hypothetical protein
MDAWFQEASDLPESAAHLGECLAPLKDLADREETAWRELREIAQG